jgi:hypothetical protein
MVAQPIGRPRLATILATFRRGLTVTATVLAPAFDAMIRSEALGAETTPPPVTLVAVRKLDGRHRDGGLRAGREAAQAVGLLGGVAELEGAVVERVGVRDAGDHLRVGLRTSISRRSYVSQLIVPSFSHPR